MIIFPAVDIQNGNAVRLKKGKKDDSTIFSDDPVKMALAWQNQGAKWLHVVDLDGAFDGRLSNSPLIAEICAALDVPVQVGGGIRDYESAAKYLDCGVRRIIIGTMALENPPLFEKICAAFPGRIGVSLDAANGRLKTRGWVEDAGACVESVLPGIEAAGASFIIYTDIERDGMRSGVNRKALEALLAATTLPVIVAGGVSCMGDVEDIASLRKHGRLDGMISGRALYDGALDLATAQKWLDDLEPQA